MTHRRHALLGLTVIAATTAACGGGSSTPSPSGSAAVMATSQHGVQQVTIHGTDMFRFSPMTVTAHPGTLRITLVDAGAYPHNIDFAGLSQRSATVSGDAGNSSTTLTLHLDKPGRYPFVCTYHSSAGMKGVVVVTPDGG